MEKAIIPNDIGQISEALRDGESTILIEPGNKNVLSEAMLNLAANQQLREKLGNTARREAKRYTWGRNAKEIIEIYRMKNRNLKICQ